MNKKDMIKFYKIAGEFFLCQYENSKVDGKQTDYSYLTKASHSFRKAELSEYAIKILGDTYLTAPRAIERKSLSTTLAAAHADLNNVELALEKIEYALKYSIKHSSDPFGYTDKAKKRIDDIVSGKRKAQHPELEPVKIFRRIGKETPLSDHIEQNHPDFYKLLKIHKQAYFDKKNSQGSVGVSTPTSDDLPF